jgi:hypothetical protein
MLDASFFFGVDCADSLGLRFYEVCTWCCKFLFILLSVCFGVFGGGGSKRRPGARLAFTCNKAIIVP